MGFTNDNGPFINEEHKIRITLSDKAKIVMAEDMNVFGTTKEATFINTVFTNYKENAKSSFVLYQQKRKLELEQQFKKELLHSENTEKTIEKILSIEQKKAFEEIKAYLTTKGTSKLYHINNNNVEYLLEDCSELQESTNSEIIYNNRPGLYIRAVIEEYCSLPFIDRERFYRKDIYDIIEDACRNKTMLKIKANYYGKDQLFHVYPYKIKPDPFNTQSYLVCYSKKTNENAKDKIIASFSMARINPPTKLSQTFHLSAAERNELETKITQYSPAYLIGTPEQIKVKLTKKGKQSYRSRLYSRPEKIESLSTDDIYVFDCTQQQIFNYFFSFGAEAEIISPEDLRNRFHKTYLNALKVYENTTSN